MFLILTTAFLDILGMSLFLPMLPSIIASFGVAGSWSGYAQAVYAIGMFIWGLFFGRLSDTYGRKKILSYTSLIYLASYIIMLWSIWHLDISTSSLSSTISEWDISSFWQLAHIFDGFVPMFGLFLISRFVSGLGGAGFGVIQAYISDISSPTDRAKNMGMMWAAFGLAFLVGPAISALLIGYISVHAIIALGVIAVFANVVSIRVFLQEPQKHQHVEEIHLVDFHFSRSIMTLLFLSFGATMGFAAIQSLSGQFYTDRFHFDARMIGYTMAVVGIISILYQGVIVRHIRAHLDEVLMLRMAFLILTVGFVGFALNESPIWLFFWVALFPLGMGSFQPSVGALMAKKAGKEVGKVMGYNTSIQSIGQIIGPIVAGVLYTPGSGLPFLVSAGVFGVLFLVAFMEIG